MNIIKKKTTEVKQEKKITHTDTNMLKRTTDPQSLICIFTPKMCYLYANKYQEYNISC